MKLRILPASMFLFAISLLAHSSVAEAGVRIGLATYNVGLLRLRKILPHSDHALFAKDGTPLVAERASLLPAALAEHASRNGIDVLALQEAWEPEHALQIRRALAAAGYRTITVRKSNASIAGSGLMLALSKRLTLKSAAFDKYPEAPFPSNLSDLGILSAEATLSRAGVPNVAVRFVNTQVPAPFAFASNAGRFERWYSRHTTAIHQRALAHLSSVLQTRTLTFLLGDLNNGPDYALPGFSEFERSSGFMDPLGFPAVKTWDAANPLVRAGLTPDEPSFWADHVMFPRSAQDRVRVIRAERIFDQPSGLRLQNEAVPLSDHYGMMVELELEP